MAGTCGTPTQRSRCRPICADPFTMMRVAGHSIGCFQHARVAKLADARDLKSLFGYPHGNARSCRVPQNALLTPVSAESYNASLCIDTHRNAEPSATRTATRLMSQTCSVNSYCE